MASTDQERWKPMTDTDRLDLEPQSTTVSPLPAAVGEFGSILFVGEDVDVGGAQEPPFFSDLNLDQVVGSIVSGRDEYELNPFFYLPLREVAAVEYRQEVFQDLEMDDVGAAVRAFGAEMRRVRSFLTLAKKQRYKYEKERWLLDAARIYCDTVSALRDALADLELRSRGLQALRTYLSSYTASARFTSVASADFAASTLGSFIGSWPRLVRERPSPTPMASLRPTTSAGSKRCA
jgi:hypothetical protein